MSCDTLVLHLLPVLFLRFRPAVPVSLGRSALKTTFGNNSRGEKKLAVDGNGSSPQQPVPK